MVAPASIDTAVPVTVKVGVSISPPPPRDNLLLRGAIQISDRVAQQTSKRI